MGLQRVEYNTKKKKKMYEFLEIYNLSRVRKKQIT